jgi:hypothetical protein
MGIWERNHIETLYKEGRRRRRRMDLFFHAQLYAAKFLT